MPLYEYRCHNCGRTFEMLRSFQEADTNLICPECASEEVERMLSAFSTGGCGGSGKRGFT